MTPYIHTPVLLSEVLNFLDPQPNQNYVDCTLGGGGYTEGLLKALAPNGRVLAIDLDHTALLNAEDKFGKSKRLVLAHGNFSQINHFVVNHKFANIAGIVADIGLSSYQIDQSQRGISFQKKEVLDMRFDQSSNEPDARFLLNHRDQRELAGLFKTYGEEKYANQIAKRIIKARESKLIKYTDELVDLIKLSLPKPVAHKYQDTARRIFQSLRIAVNHELENLQTFLPKAFDILAPKGKFVVVTFHSLEDRIVKNYFKALTQGCVCPPEFPICKCGRLPQGQLLTKKAVTASEEELSLNPRAKSAKLRAIEKL